MLSRSQLVIMEENGSYKALLKEVFGNILAGSHIPNHLSRSVQSSLAIIRISGKAVEHIQENLVRVVQT